MFARAPMSGQLKKIRLGPAPHKERDADPGETLGNT